MHCMSRLVELSQYCRLWPNLGAWSDCDVVWDRQTSSSKSVTAASHKLKTFSTSRKAQNRSRSNTDFSSASTSDSNLSTTALIRRKSWPMLSPNLSQSQYQTSRRNTQHPDGTLVVSAHTRVAIAKMAVVSCPWKLIKVDLLLPVVKQTHRY